MPRCWPTTPPRLTNASKETTFKEAYFVAALTVRGPENYIVLFFDIIGVLKSPWFNIHITR